MERSVHLGLGILAGFLLGLGVVLMLIYAGFVPLHWLALVLGVVLGVVFGALWAFLVHLLR